MSSTLLEQTRSNHEEVERLERLVVQDLQTEARSSRDRLVKGHGVRHMIESIMLTTEKLVETYEDEIGVLGGQTATGTNVYSVFYDRLKEIGEYHRKHISGRLEAVLKEEPVIAFRGEEGFGRYLDLHDMYNQYINSKFGERIEYSAYLDVFSQPEKLKLSRQYRNYMEALLEYLVYFFQRTEPLQDLDRILSETETDFEEQYADGKVENELTEIALTEAKVKKLCYLLDETIQRTKQNVVRKQSLTYEEMEGERQGEEANAESESDDEDGQIYNPLKLPMGWDGKPIPYWLYKLHGLGQEFKCEICGNYSYWGRRAFERHFKEWRHQHGMRCLGIPNTKNFNEITSIEEAKELWKRIQERQGVNKWRPELVEEYEDRQGNIYNNKT